MTDEVLVTIQPTRMRRGLAVAMLVVLGVFLIYLGFFSATAGAVLQVVFVLLGAAALMLSQHLWRATDVTLILTDAALTDSTGRVLCRTEDIEAVQRSAFDFKPSNGFAIRLKRRAKRAWVPGLWWRYGKKLGVGGVVSKQEAKHMADVLALRMKLPDLHKMQAEIDAETADSPDNRKDR